MSLPKYVCRYHINRCSLMIYCGASSQAGDRVGGRHGKTGGLQGLQQMLTAFFSYTSKSIRMTYSYFFYFWKLFQFPNRQLEPRFQASFHYCASGVIVMQIEYVCM